MVIHENNGKYYYDHELIEIKKAEHRRLPGTTGVNENSDSILNIIQNLLFSTGFDKENSKNLEFRKKRLRQQINPIVRDGRVRDEYADLLENKEYTPEKIADWQEKAFEWILKRGGIVQAAEDFLADKAPSDGHIAELARRFILNSDVADEGLSIEERTKLYDDKVI